MPLSTELLDNNMCLPKVNPGWLTDVAQSLFSSNVFLKKRFRMRVTLNYHSQNTCTAKFVKELLIFLGNCARAQLALEKILRCYVSIWAIFSAIEFTVSILRSSSRLLRAPEASSSCLQKSQEACIKKIRGGILNNCAKTGTLAASETIHSISCLLASL